MPWEVQDVLAEERHIGLVEVQHCVTSSKLRAKDDLKKRRDYISLTFTDFLEAFCRLASRMCFPTQLMLMNLDIPTAWEVHARRRTAKDYNDQKKLQEIDARMRPVVPGEGKLKGMESPLYGEKLRGAEADVDRVGGVIREDGDLGGLVAQSLENDGFRCEVGIGHQIPGSTFAFDR